MSDLLDDLRALNPVPACEPPSIAEVWRKLDGERAEDATAGRSRRRSRRGGRPRSVFTAGAAVVAVTAVAVVVLVVVVASGRAGSLQHHNGDSRPAASAAVLRRLATGTISCDYASAGGGAAGARIPTRGRSAITYCRDHHPVRGASTGAATRARFVVCQTSATNVAVYLADGLPGRCRRLGEPPVPAGYAAAVARAGSAAAPQPSAVAAVV